MPIHSRASTRYARALLLAAEQTGTLGLLREETEAIRGLIDGVPEFRAFLENPTIAMQHKLRIMEQIFGEKVSPLMRKFLRMLTEKYRERLLPDILDAARTLLDEREGRLAAEVTSAVELSAEQRNRLKNELERVTGKQVRLTVEVDDSLIAGFVAKVGDTVFDASLPAQLRRLRQRLVQADLRAASRTI